MYSKFQQRTHTGTTRCNWKGNSHHTSCPYRDCLATVNGRTAYFSSYSADVSSQKYLGGFRLADGRPARHASVQSLEYVYRLRLLSYYALGLALGSLQFDPGDEFVRVRLLGSFGLQRGSRLKQHVVVRCRFLLLFSTLVLGSRVVLVLLEGSLRVVLLD